MKLRSFAVGALMLGTAAVAAPVLAPPPELGPDVQPFIHVPAGKIAITHLRIIDGTGAAPVEDATLLIEGAKIGAVLPAGSAVPAGYRTLDGSGETALPGLVGMHNHLYYIARPNIDAAGKFEQPIIVPQMTFCAPRLYLGGRRDHDAHHRQRRALHRPQPEDRDRRRPHGRAAHRRDRPLPRRARAAPSSRCTT